MSRRSAYEQAGGDGDGAIESSIEHGSPMTGTARQLSAELRRHVRKLRSCDPFTSGWLDVHESCSKVGSVAYLESRRGKVPGAPESGDTFGGEAPPDFGVGQDSGRETVWDSGSALAVRYILEEGKLNLSLRMLIDYKRALLMLDADPDSKVTEGALDSLAKDIRGRSTTGAELLKKSLLFEQSMGVILATCLATVEAVQSIDAPYLFEHCARVLKAALSCDDLSGRTGLEWMQEAMIPRYLASVAAHFEDVDEDRLVSLAVDHDVPQLLARHIDKHGDDLGAVSVAAAGLALAGFFDTDSGSGASGRARIFPDPSARAALVRAHEKFWKPTCREKLDTRRKLQALIDAYRDFEED